MIDTYRIRLPDGGGAIPFENRTDRLDEIRLVLVLGCPRSGTTFLGSRRVFAIGGFDEAFVGWGGEDNEFWERAQVRAAWSWQPGKGRRGRRDRERSRITSEARVAELAGRRFGLVEGPDPPFPAAAAPAGGEESEDGRAG